MTNELIDLLSRSRVKGIKLVIEVTPQGVASKLVDHKGQRGSAVSGNHDEGDFGTLSGQARFLLIQEAELSLNAAHE